MKRCTIKPICLAIGLALAGSASATTIDFSGSNFYMKFLDGSQQGAPTGSIDTATGGDQGQFTELNLIFKATVSPQVEAGGRIQSRSSAAYWTEFGGFGQENAAGGYTADQINHQKFMKLRGAYVELSPGYSWLSQVRVGTSDWGMFDPFTVGKVRYIDRDNYNGLYFKGPIVAGSTWELARVSLPSYLQFNWGNGPVCCSADSTQYNEAVYIAQFKMPVAGWKLAASYQTFSDHKLGAANTVGFNKDVFYQSTASSLKAEGSPLDGIDLRGAYYQSSSDTGAGTFGETWGNAPRSSFTDRAFKVDVDWTTPVDGLSLSYQHFNIGAGYYSPTAARRESDVLLTEGSESAWYNWGSAIWAGGATADYTQSASNGMITDNAYMDFNESPAQSAVGWKGHTLVGKYEVASTPMSLEVSRIGYNNNWQNYSATGPLSNMYALNQDRKTDVVALKVNHNFPVAGGLDTNFKFKKVTDTDNVQAGNAADDAETKDSGYSLSAGNQLVSQLYGTVSYGKYNRDVSVGTASGKNDKNIVGVRLAYNLSGFEFGMLTQWIHGNADLALTGTQTKFYQYRMKAFAQVNF